MTDPDDQSRRASPTRIGIWVLVSAVGLYLVISGLGGVIAGQG